MSARYSDSRGFTYHDDKGYPVVAGDVLKVFHFRGGPRHKRYYLYKIVFDIEGILYAVDCCGIATEGVEKAHRCPLSILRDSSYEIVQGYGPDGLVCYEDRPRLKPLRTKGETE